MKREKRLKKGIESLKEEIDKHKDKLRKAVEEGNQELTSYYVKEIDNLEKEEKKKAGQLGD